MGEVAKEVARLLTVHEEALHTLARELFGQESASQATK